MQRVFCLYRVSSVGQVDHDDIPLQRIACREYAEEHGWTIIREVYEKGVSGYKVSSDNRDAIQELKEAAEKKQFDILLVFMFDRLGRRDDETPFVVQWFAKHGIEVWSVKEGQQRFDSHVDKLMNYIRYWQASGESEKTSIRVRTRQVQMIQDGHFRGGAVPYGYKLEYLGRVNKKNQPVRDLVIDEEQAAIVRQMFELMVKYGYGTDRITRWLNENHMPTSKKADIWRSTSVRHIMRNVVYTGRLHLGEDISNAVYEQYQIVSDEVFKQAQDTMDGRGPNRAGTDGTGIPWRTDGRILLTGLVFCGKCGGRMFGSSSFSMWRGKRRYWNQYRCETRLRKKDGCTGQWCYSASRLEDRVLCDVKQVFARILAIDGLRMAGIVKANVSRTSTEIMKLAAEQLAEARGKLSAHENRLLVCIAAEQTDEVQALNDELPELRSAVEKAESEYTRIVQKSEDEIRLLEQQMQELQSLRTWAVNFDLLSHEEQKLALARIVRRVTISDGYVVTVEFRGIAEWVMAQPDTEQHSTNL